MRQVTTVFSNPREELLAEDYGDVNKKNSFPPCPECIVNIEGLIVSALLDSGSEVTCMAEELYNELVIRNPKLTVLPVVGVTILGATNKRSKRVTKQVYARITVDGKETEIACIVVSELIRKLILGVDWLYNNNVKLNFDNGKVIINNHQINPSLITMQPSASEGERMVVGSMTINTSEVPETVIKIQHLSRSRYDNEDPDRITEAEIREQINSQSLLNDLQKQQMIQLLSEYRDVFSERPGLINCYEYKINVIKESHYFEKTYPVPFAYREAVEAQLNKMIAWGVIERANSPYVNPLVVVIKKDRTVRLCLDARQCNANLVPDRECPHIPEEILQQFNNVNWLSSIDLTSSYWQIGLTPESKQYTAFKYNQRTYQFKVLPFGLSTSVGAFTRAMDLVLGEEVKDFTKPYVDDLLVSSETFEEHLRHLRMIFERCRLTGAKLNFAKSKFGRDSVPFLGHILTPSGVSPDPKKLLLIQNWPVPRNVRQLKALLGLCNYYRRFQRYYSNAVVKLQTLLKKGVKWLWTPELNQDFENLKTMFIKKVGLAYPHYNKPFYIQCDASDFGIGGQLYQLDDNQEIQVISMSSRLLRGGELNYTISEKELLAIVHCLLKFRIFVLGSNDLTIITDHKALTFILQCRLLSNRLTRWILAIQEFHFKIIHCTGKENKVADILSRFPQQDNGEIVESVSRERELVIAKINLSVDKPLKARLKQLSVHQATDAYFGNIIAELSADPTSPASTKYLLFKSLLYHKPNYHDQENTWKVCVPAGLVNEVIWGMHKEIGHFGATKCLAALQESFYWKGMGRSVRKTIPTCDLCQKTKHTNCSLHGTYQYIIPQKMGELVATDIYGPLPKGVFASRYILVFVDLFSKYVSLYVLRNATANACVLKVEDYVARVQCPENILSDHGSQYTSHLWYETLESHQIRALHSSIRHPQSNPCERIMRELGRFFRAYCNQGHAGWVKMVPQIEYWINGTFHESIGITPYELHHRQHPERGIARLFKYPAPDPCLITDEMKLLMAKARMNKQGEKRKKRHALKHPVKTELIVGDLVLLKILNVSNLGRKEAKKFFPLYEGPFEISAIAGSNAYELTNERGVVKGVFNIVNLKKYLSVE